MIRSAIACTALVAGLLASVAAAPARVVTIAQAAQVSPADAAPFMGDWTLTLQGPNGPGSFDLSIKVEKEKVVGEIANPQVGTQAITDVTKTDKGLMLRYSFPYEGNPVDAAVALSPGADGKIVAQIDFGGGAYVMSGTAAKKEKPKP
jgi:hypothetical protein